MKFFPLLFAVLLLFFSIVPPTRAGENEEKSSSLLSEFKSEIEQFRSLANEPIPTSSPPDLPLMTYEKGLNFLHAGNGSSAIHTLKELAGSTPASESLKKEVHAALGYIYLDQNRPKEALEEFAFLEKDDGFRERVLFGIAWGLLEQEEYVKTIAVFEELVNVYPNGENTPEAYSKTGYCYSRLLSYKNAVKNYQKALHLYNKRLLAQKDLLRASDRLPAFFQRGFIFSNPDPEWKFFFSQIKNDPQGLEFLQEAEGFFNLEERVNKNPVFQQSSPQYRQNLSEARVRIQALFQKFIQEQIKEKRQNSQDLSTETAIELARNMVLEQSLPRQNSGAR